jgi:outer membrane beta-barrel protein
MTGVTMGRGKIVRALLTAALLGAPSQLLAQPRSAQPTPPAGGDDSSSMTFGAEEATAQPAPAAATPSGSGDSPLPSLTVPGGDVAAQRHRLQEEIYAVQQIYALRNHRFEINPSANFSLNDPFVSHTGFGLSMNYWISNVLAVGVTGVFFQGLNASSDVNYFVGRSAELVVPINEYQLAAAVNFSYVPLYGKFSMFNRFIFHWDMYLTAGVGIMRTRPIPAVDPEVRTFDWNTRILFDAGLGFRVFVSRSVAITAELRNFIYPELLENTNTNLQETGPGAGGAISTTCSTCRRNPANWTRDTSLTDNVMLSVGLTVFLPFSFSYHLPK